MKDIYQLFQMILSTDDLARIKVTMRKNNIPKIVADTHGLSCKQAKVFIKNLICVCRDAFILVIIHGYNRGTAIKELIRENFDLPRVKNMHSPEYNPGETILQICKA